MHTDISNCYGSIYTHSIPWALLGKNMAKTYRDDNNLLGNILDKKIRDLQNGQTNGIPQGSGLMDFIAEIVLLHIDILLNEEIKKNTDINDYKILRYRDDYRIYSNTSKNAEKITQILSRVLEGLGMSLNSKKTSLTTDIIRKSIKEDKQYWNVKNSIVCGLSLQKHLLEILYLSKKFPNCGQLNKALSDFEKRVQKQENIQDVYVITSILITIMIENPRTIAIIIGILSKVISGVDKETQKDIIEKIYSKYQNVPNNEYIEIWMQRLILPINLDKEFKSNLCNLVSVKNGQGIKIFNCDPFSKEINSEWIINKGEIEKLSEIISSEEFSDFSEYTADI